MRYLIKFSYDGTGFVGFQKQGNLRTVEKALNDAATSINNDKVTKIVATGRTDKGVHAKCQYAHLDIDVSITPYKLKRALNSKIDNDIYVIDCFKVNDSFHARYNVFSKTYKYYINTGVYNPMERNYVYQHNYKLDVESMKKAIKYFIGEHDFRAFVTENSIKDNCVRKIYDASIEYDEKLIITFTGNGFMRYQVRNMVGLLIKVGTGKINYTEVKKILDSKSRKTGGVTAKACGLYLYDVEYEELDKYIIG